jgi:cell wall-associated NlpC family hydrolase
VVGRIKVDKRDEPEMPVERRRLATLAVVIVVGALVGCGLNGESANNAPNTTQPAETSKPPAETTTPPTEETTARAEGSNAEPPSVAEAVADEIDDASVRRNLAHLTGVSPAPLASGAVTIAERGSPGGRWATAQYMKESFEEAGIPTRILTFSSEHGRGYNVEATLQGTEGGKHLWVTAHLDSVHNAGANDNASGLVLLIMTAKALERLDLKHTVHFVAYDLEEVGLVGSSYYIESVVNSIRNQKGDRAIIGNINSDMVGYETDEFNAVLGNCGQAGAIDDAILQASERIDPPIVIGEYCLGRTDHKRFWDVGLPAVVLTDGAMFDGYPWYHTPDDMMDKINIAYLRSMIQLAATTSALLAVPE